MAFKDFQVNDFHSDTAREQQESKERDFVTFLIKVAIGVFCFLVIVVGGCTAHSNTFDEARIRAEAELQKAQTEYTAAQNQIRIEEIAAIERLVKEGVNPFTAACGFQDFNRMTSGDISACAMVAAGAKK